MCWRSQRRRESGRLPPGSHPCPHRAVPLVWLPSVGIWEQSEDSEMLLVLREEKLKMWLPNMKLARHWPIRKYPGALCKRDAPHHPFTRSSIQQAAAGLQAGSRGLRTGPTRRWVSWIFEHKHTQSEPRSSQGKGQEGLSPIPVRSFFPQQCLRPVLSSRDPAVAKTHSVHTHREPALKGAGGEAQKMSKIHTDLSNITWPVRSKKERKMG